MKIGDKLRFKKLVWEIVDEDKSQYTGEKFYKYRVYRKYFWRLVPLSNTKQSYVIRPWRWNFLKEKLKENPNYHYNMSLWSNASR